MGPPEGSLSAVPLNPVGPAHRVGGVLTGVLAWAVLFGGIAFGGIVGVVVGAGGRRAQRLGLQVGLRHRGVDQEAFEALRAACCSRPADGSRREASSQ
ncbi:MAG: hypothetical protein IPF99_41035 [Deltaproteobacteria bacterium]|nr:hypothetical protein [Deltaproteobacteria bacterium]